MCILTNLQFRCSSVLRRKGETRKKGADLRRTSAARRERKRFKTGNVARTSPHQLQDEEFLYCRSPVYWCENCSKLFFSAFSGCRIGRWELRCLPSVHSWRVCLEIIFIHVSGQKGEVSLIWYSFEVWNIEQIFLQKLFDDFQEIRGVKGSLRNSIFQANFFQMKFLISEWILIFSSIIMQL